MSTAAAKALPAAQTPSNLKNLAFPWFAARVLPTVAITPQLKSIGSMLVWQKW